MKTRKEIDEISRQVVDCCVKVHRELGPGLLESTYQLCLAHEL
jgi:GxxExxY protein